MGFNLAKRCVVLFRPSFQLGAPRSGLANLGRVDNA